MPISRPGQGPVLLGLFHSNLISLAAPGQIAMAPGVSVLLSHVALALKRLLPWVCTRLAARTDSLPSLERHLAPVLVHLDVTLQGAIG